ncbi:MAG TPA: quinone oxidoreductase [Jatrophihabitans sp.]|nr:quinone oxidoreductase [Jatrophihabitans sp.]
MAQEMRAVVVPKHGGVDVLEVQTRPRPEPGPGQLLVQVAASGVNFIDVYQREGVYDVPTPFVLGGESAGRVVAVGDGVSEFSVGDVVATARGQGTHATYALIPAEGAVPVPDGVAPELAAAVMLQGMTAHYLVNSTYAVQPGESVLVHAAAGGMGQLLVQMAKAKGAHVIATVGSPAKVEVARKRGADEVIRYDETDDLAAAVRDLEPAGVHVAYDGVGKATFEASLASLRRRGMLALFGASSGRVPPFDLQRLNPAGSLFVTRPTLAHYTADRAELTWRAGDVLGAVADGSLHVDIGGRYHLEDAAQAYVDLEGRRSIGKLLIVP